MGSKSSKIIKTINRHGKHELFHYCYVTKLTKLMNFHFHWKYMKKHKMFSSYFHLVEMVWKTTCRKYKIKKCDWIVKKHEIFISFSQFDCVYLYCVQLNLVFQPCQHSNTSNPVSLFWDLKNMIFRRDWWLSWSSSSMVFCLLYYFL